MTVDNFDLIEEFLKFESEDDFLFPSSDSAQKGRK